MAGPAQLDGERIGKVRRKDDDRIAQCAAVLGRSERHDVNARAPSRLGWAAAEPCQRIRKARSIHMDLEAAPLGHLGDRTDLVERVDSAEIRRLRQIDRARLSAVNLPWRNPGQRFSEAVGIDSAIVAADRSQL